MPQSRFSLVVLWLLAASLSTSADAADTDLSLAEAVGQTLEANLDLAAQRRALAAEAEEISIARSTLLPQITLGARAQWIEDDRSDSHRGNTTERSGNLAASLDQVLYDETAWADYEIQKLVYTGRARQFDAFRLGVIQDAADAFLELDRSRALPEDQVRNRELTRRNLETSRQRVNAGWSGEREVLRWESQLSQNDRKVVEDRTSALVTRFELNRVRNQPPEEPVAIRAASIEEEGFVYARKAIRKAVASPEGDRRMRDTSEPGGLPSVSPTEDRVRMAQRFPVRITLVNPDPAHPLRKEMRATVRINATAEPGSDAASDGGGSYR